MSVLPSTTVFRTQPRTMAPRKRSGLGLKREGCVGEDMLENGGTGGGLGVSGASVVVSDETRETDVVAFRPTSILESRTRRRIDFIRQPQQ